MKRADKKAGDAPAVAFDELPAELKDVLRKRGVRAPRKVTFSKNDVRTYALRCLAALADLAPSERARVLQHAAKVNRV